MAPGDAADIVAATLRRRGWEAERLLYGHGLEQHPGVSVFSRVDGWKRVIATIVISEKFVQCQGAAEMIRRLKNVVELLESSALEELEEIGEMEASY